jgi:hypothetical protein
MSRPLTQHDDVLREMTDEEHAQYLEQIANITSLPEATVETPSAD